LDAALGLAAPRGTLPLPDDVCECLDVVEPDDWLAAVIELTRAGPGTPADAESLLVLSARCMDVDSGAVDPVVARVLSTVFEVVVAVWEATGVVDADGALTRLGAWGLPLALARMWGGDLG
jgi:hypothetical protein